MMVGWMLLGLALCGLFFLLLMLYLQRQVSMDDVSESSVPHKLTSFEQTKEIQADNTVSSVPVGEQLPAMYADKNDVPPVNW